MSADRFELFCEVYLREPKSEFDKAIGFLWILARFSDPEVQFTDLMECFSKAGLAVPNPSRLRARLKSSRQVLRGKRENSFRLSREVHRKFDLQYGPLLSTASPAITPLIESLISHSNQIDDLEIRSFVEEAIGCAKQRFYRASIVFSWIGAVAVLHDYVISHEMTALSADLLSRRVIKKPLTRKEDLAKIKESEFLDSLERIGLLDSTGKKSLVRCLGRRNDFGHPTSAKARESAVADHLDTLIELVFSRFA